MTTPQLALVVALGIWAATATAAVVLLACRTEDRQEHFIRSAVAFVGLLVLWPLVAVIVLTAKVLERFKK